MFFMVVSNSCVWLVLANLEMSGNVMISNTPSRPHALSCSACCVAQELKQWLVQRQNILKQMD
jgi:hypothetical protein